MVFLATQIYIIYSVFIEDRVMVNYFLNHQLIDPSSSIKINPDVDFWLFLLLV